MFQFYLKNFYVNLVMFSDEIKNLVLFRRSLAKAIRKITKNLQLKKCSIETIISYKKRVIKQKGGHKMKINKANTLSIKRFVANQNNPE